MLSAALQPCRRPHAGSPTISSSFRGAANRSAQSAARWRRSRNPEANSERASGFRVRRSAPSRN